MKYLASIPIILLTACSGANDELVIENFKSGLVCPDPDAQDANSKKHKPRICFENDTLLITGQGTCIFNGETHPCTWYGYEFDYRNAKPNQRLQCKTKSNSAESFGNPDRIEKERSKTYNFELELDHNKTHFFNPTYSIFGYRPAKKNIVKLTTECFADSKRVIKYSKELIYPETPEKL